jgi:hypothetical protein
MKIEFDDNGKFFTDIVAKTPQLVTIQTPTHQIIGKIHITGDLRLKDELDLPERFVAITEAVVYSLDGRALYRAEFLAVQRSDIIWVMPDSGTVDLLKGSGEND